MEKILIGSSPDSSDFSQSDLLLSTIFEYMGKMSTETDITKMLLLLADLGTKLVQADRCTVWLHEPATRNVWTVAGHGVERITITDTSGFVGRSIQTGKLINVEDAYMDERFNTAVDQETGYRTRSILCIPFNNREGKIIGAFQAINKLGNSRFSKKDEELLTFASTYAGKSLDAFILHNELLDTQKEIIETMGEIGESRSQETGNHVKRVATYSYKLAQLAGISEPQALLLRYASPMHDIGKVATPDRILLKPGKLTPKEFEEMKLHTVIGYHVFRKSERELLKTAAIIAYEHHERWEGGGYPRGLKEEEIHIFGRITAVADVFDALGSDRVYKKAWPLEEIVTYMSQQRGKQFDPALIDIFLEHLDEFVAIRDRYTDRM
ncbi:HD domain-containing phosphohydrolase [Sporosarcina gallistercoris]|uniref:HD domain-containing protein n=1 Tax=Sporosarcina gallistercoris TaxID=2762245 RepID=A0ABR8PF03_9BACL|nr:HD domain-containing phosphohydrolase [Sporosarcina gallistercoris]MBD7906741.1 HD domain-containing protein [Sporosarcina gallistercoris]